jgi:hypothetical protein
MLSGVPTSLVMPSSVKNVSCDSFLFDKAIAVPRNTLACAKPPHPLMNMSSEIWGTVNMPSPHGLRYCLLVIDHHTNFMWVRFPKSKDDTCSELDEPILLEVRYLHARFQYASSAIAPVLKFDSYSVFEAKATRHMCGRLGVGAQHPTLTTCLERRSVPGVRKASIDNKEHAPLYYFVCYAQHTIRSPR